MSLARGSETSDQALAALCQEALNVVERVLNQHPPDAPADLGAMERSVSRLRDRLIERLRQDGARPEAEGWRGALKQANAVLSLVVGVEYPVGSIKWTALEQARDVLKQMLNDRLV